MEPHRIVPDPPRVHDGDEESLDVWGFADTGFRVNDRGHAEVTGSRYELSGHELPALLPWVRRVMEIPFSAEDQLRPGGAPEVPRGRATPLALERLQGVLDASRVETGDRIRLRHGHGQTQEEMYGIKYGQLARVPDVVVFPESDGEVAALVRLALELDLCLIPYGGGTNVSEALSCPPDEARVIVSVDMRDMNRVLSIDPENRTACIQAGAVGRQIAELLAQHGFTMGHEPDSVELSTLGGWISTHASGMKKNRYGNIEDLVLDVTVVTPAGRLERQTVVPRESTGLDPRKLIFGSEGTLGIITSAVVRIFHLPAEQRYGSIVFPSFDHGVGFMHELARTNARPASVRLVDNLQFQFGQVLRPASSGWRRLRSRLQTRYVTALRGFEPGRMAACTILFEGSREEVRWQAAAVHRIARGHGGLQAGRENGRRGYQLTFAIAYIRDFIMNHYILGESFETSLPWNRVAELCEKVKARVRKEHGRRNLPGQPFISSRVTQIYHSGACVYFYLGLYVKGVEQPSAVFAQIERAAREEILANGGSLSHHHGIGKLRARFLPDIMSPVALAWNRSFKQAVDPGNVFGCRNQGLRAALPQEKVKTC